MPQDLDLLAHAMPFRNTEAGPAELTPTPLGGLFVLLLVIVIVKPRP